MDSCQLKNYGFGTGHNSHALIIVGPGNIYNHHNVHTIGRFWNDTVEKDPTNAGVPFTAFRPIHYKTLYPIAAGEEMFETYGTNWFQRLGNGHSDRKVVEATQQAKLMDLADLEQHGHCLTDVEIKESTIRNAGNGLFATRDFEVGEVVTVSPVLALPKHVVDDSAVDSVLKNYCFSREKSELALLPINYGPMINHQAGDGANVEVGWYDWSPAVRRCPPSTTRGGRRCRSCGWRTSCA